MRKEKWKELQQLLEQYKVVEEIKLENKDTPFLWGDSYRYKLNDGSIMEMERLNTKFGVGDATAVLPVTKDGEIVFIVQPRPNTREGVCVEIPAGYKEHGEDAKIVGRRELEEETGLICKEEDMHHITNYNQDNGKSRAKISVYIATNCIDTMTQHLDEHEKIKLFRCRVDEAYDMLESGQLHGASTQLALTMGKKLLRRRDK